MVEKRYALWAVVLSCPAPTGTVGSTTRVASWHTVSGERGAEVAGCFFYAGPGVSPHSGTD